LGTARLQMSIWWHEFTWFVRLRVLCGVLQRVRVWRSAERSWRGSWSLPASLRPTTSSWSTSADTWPGSASRTRPAPGFWDRPSPRPSSSTLLSGTQVSQHVLLTYSYTCDLAPQNHRRCTLQFNLHPYTVLKVHQTPRVSVATVPKLWAPVAVGETNLTVRYTYYRNIYNLGTWTHFLLA